MTKQGASFLRSSFLRAKAPNEAWIKELRLKKNVAHAVGPGEGPGQPLRQLFASSAQPGQQLPS